MDGRDDIKSQNPKRRLGRGLAALIGDDEEIIVPVAENSSNLRLIPIEHIHPNPCNPRKNFAPEELQDLANSIREKGLLQPLVVRTRADGEYEIIAGERRWRAAQLASVHELPALLRELTDAESLEVALIENIQRENLNPLEEAQAYNELIAQFSYTQQQLAEAVGKSRSHIANTIRLLSLPPEVRTMINDGQLSAGHARTLVSSSAPEAFAHKIVALRLSVREAEELARDKTEKQVSRQSIEKNADIRAFENQLSEATGLKIVIKQGPKEAGKLIIDYLNLDQLEDVSRRLAAPR